MEKSKLSQMKHCYKIIYYLDMFKSPVALLFNSKEKLATKFGSFISSGIIVFLLIFFFQSDLFHRKMPFTTIQTYYEKTRPNLQFTNDNMGLAFGIQENSNQFIAFDPSIYTITVFWSYVNSSTGDMILEEEKKLKFCQKSALPIDENTYEDLKLENSFCMVDGNFSLKGYWDEQSLSNLQIILKLCNNQTSEVICQSPEIIIEYFTEKYLTIFYINNIIDVYNYDLPIQTAFEVQYMSLDAHLNKELSIYFSKAEFISDDGIIFSSQKTIETFQFAETTTDSTTNMTNEIAVISLYTYNEVYSVNRRYQKFQEAVANVGGLANSLLLIGALLTYLEKEFIVFTTIMNKIKISEISENILKKTEATLTPREIKKVENSNHIFKMINPKILPPDPFILEHYSEKNIVTQLKTKKETSLQSDSKKLKTKDENLDKISFFEFLKIKFSLPCKLNEKERFLAEAYKIYPKEIDLIEIIQKIHEIDKLKIHLNEQKKMFDFSFKFKKELIKTNV